MTRVTGRRLTPEHMDDPAATREEIAEALAYIRQVNRRLGGAKAAIHHFSRWSRRWTPGRTIRILDVGTGLGDIPLAIVEWARAAGHRVEVVGVDLHPITADQAREFTRNVPEIAIERLDAMELGGRFKPGSFDYAHAGMFLHHLNDVQAMTVLAIMDRLASRGVIWNDLVRGVIGRIGVRLLSLGAPAIVRHDAVVSVDAGFTKREALDLARRAGLERIAYRRFLAYRFTLTGEKPAG